MKYICVAGDCLATAYHRLLRRSIENSYPRLCPDWNTTEYYMPFTMVVTLDPDPDARQHISKMIPCGPVELQQYKMEMLDGILDFEVERKKWPYTYHQRMGSQIDFVIDELRRNPESRRAVVNIRTPEDMGSNDPACLQHIQYTITADTLNCFVLFRSNDIPKATFMNAFALIELQKKIAKELGLSVGEYVHNSNCGHIYEKDYARVKNFSKEITNHMDHGDLETTGLFIEDEDDWYEQMECSIPMIIEKVEKLKGE